MLAYLVMGPLGPHPLIRSFDGYLPVEGRPQPARVGRPLSLVTCTNISTPFRSTLPYSNR
jgi:hypothetical protein